LIPQETKMSEKEKLEIEIKLLLSLNHVPAWTGSLENLKQSSYVKFSDVIKLINEKKQKLKDL
jgi:hypothetical protein